MLGDGANGKIYDCWSVLYSDLCHMWKSIWITMTHIKFILILIEKAKTVWFAFDKWKLIGKFINIRMLFKKIKNIKRTAIFLGFFCSIFFYFILNDLIQINVHKYGCTLDDSNSCFESSNQTKTNKNKMNSKTNE